MTFPPLYELVDRIKRYTASGFPYRVTAAELNAVGVTAVNVLTNLQQHGRYDVTVDPTSSVYVFHRGCAHSQVEEIYTKLGQDGRYKVEAICTRCNDLVKNVIRLGGESAAYKIITRPDHFPITTAYDGLPETGAAVPGAVPGDDAQGDAEEALREGEGSGEGESSSDDPSESEEGSGGSGEGEGEGEEDGEGDEDEGAEIPGEFRDSRDENEAGDGKDSEEQEQASESGVGSGEGETGDGKDSKGQDSEKNSGGDEGDEGDAPPVDCDDPDPLKAVWKRIWETTLTTEQKQAAYQRATFLRAE